jgi:hypothetical protein
MDLSQKIWLAWVNKLQQYGMADLVASLMEAGAPLAVIGAQAVYIGQPLLTSFWPRMNLAPLTELLENDASYRDFIGGLRKAGEA